MKHDEDGWQLESVPFEDETDPSFPSRLGERGAAQGSLNVSGSPRIDRTNPHFLWPASKPSQEPESKIVTKPVSKEPTQVGLGEKSPKEAVTQDAPVSRESAVSGGQPSGDAPPVSSAQRELDKNLLLAGIAPALAPDESGLRERVKEDDDERARRERNESIDELIDGLPFEAALPRKKSARRIREEEESRPRRPPLPSLTAQGPLHTGTGDIAAALRERAERAKVSRSGSLVPAGLSQGRTPIIGGMALLAGLIVAAFFVARSTNPTPAAPSAASAPAAVTAATAPIENIPPPAATAATPTEAESAAVPVVVTAPSASDSARASASAARARNANGAPHAKRASQGGEGTGLDTSSLDSPSSGAGKRPRAAATEEPAAPPASPVPSSDDKLLTGH
ncbi:hypothetical protein LVJ94_14355 [Pendulispora rubella]|uniref:Uncharacterized protein n=1 Tax=Pendulispora rubella TaxID=2741070 RepID=A0ABZ2LFS6_9BACT